MQRLLKFLRKYDRKKEGQFLERIFGSGEEVSWGFTHRIGRWSVLLTEESNKSFTSESNRENLVK